MKALGLLLLIAVLSGCASVKIDSFATLEITENANALTQTEGAVNYHGIPLESGQIIVSNSNTALNLIVTLTDDEYHPFAHAGIISIENNKPYVYHAIAKLRLLFNGSPTDLTKGVITRTPLGAFLKGKAVIEIYQPSSASLGEEMAAFAIRSHVERLPYDAVFDSVDRSRVYCSEFIVSAIESGGGTPVPLRPRSRHPSIDTIYQWLSIEATGHYFVHDLISNNKRVAHLSLDLTAKQTELFILLREELHRRFKPDQKIGYIMSWTGFGVALRPQVKLFIQRGLEQNFRNAFAGETLRDWVSALADDALGPVETD
jgi:hypothetical protein